MFGEALEVGVDADAEQRIVGGQAAASLALNPVGYPMRDAAVFFMGPDYAAWFACLMVVVASLPAAGIVTGNEAGNEATTSAPASVMIHDK